METHSKIIIPEEQDNPILKEDIIYQHFFFLDGELDLVDTYLVSGRNKKLGRMRLSKHQLSGGICSF